MHRIYKIIFIFSVGLVIISIGSLLMYGLKLGADFEGGSVLELEFNNGQPNTEELGKVLVGYDELLVTRYGERGIIFKMKEITEEDHQKFLTDLSAVYGNENITERKFESIGPVVGQELKNKSLVAISFVLVAIVVYIAFVFRKIGKTLSPWIMGMAAVVALLHDLIIPLGIFAVLGKFYGVEISAIFVAAVLTILGYSVSDTVVVFDRVRENIVKGTRDSFDTVVHKSIMQTLTRSLNTTFTTLLSLFAIYFFGGESIKYFALMLMIGIFLGAYSSIFVAAPILIWWSGKSRQAPGR